MSEYSISLPVFEGPLDLLLRLIERAELDVTAIALASVADQFVAYVRELEQPEPRMLAEFISMAARLLLIKSRALLPRPEAANSSANDDDDAEELAARLREYRQFKQIAQQLAAWQHEERRSFSRLAAPNPEQATSQPPLNHTVADLIAAVQRRMQLSLPLEEVSETLMLKPRLTVRDVALRVRERLERRPWFQFDDLLPLTLNRQELVVTLWAVLELLRRGAVVVEQSELFGPISIGRGSTNDVALWSLDDDAPPLRNEEGQ